jgi:hypothetical protein
LEWLNSSTWSDYTVSDFWPHMAVRASETKWVGLHRIGEWLIHVPMTIVLFALFVFCLWLSICLDTLGNMLDRRMVTVPFSAKQGDL